MTTHPHPFPRTVIITGGNTGLGYSCARTIAASGMNCHIVIASRNQQQALQAVNTLKREIGNQQIESMSLDLATFSNPCST